MKIPIFDNEEELKSKLLQPYLEDLGFDHSEISLEKTFTIRLGKSVNEISTKDKHGRLDLLCHKNHKNLFVVELKRDSAKITQSDIDQGISYSRLLDNIAPFTIISNGRETKVFDTITREELNGTKIADQSPFWLNEGTLSTEEDLKIRHLALKNFVSFSEVNLKLFCEKQVHSRMDTIIGPSSDLSSKFIKDIYLKRSDLHYVFNEFVNSESSIFALIGNAGVGKTNSICALALESLNERFTLFYNAAVTNKSPLDFISKDLNLFFSDKKEREKVLKQLNDLGEFVKKKIIVFIDAIDEAGDQAFNYEISELAYAARNYKNIKFCISCKLSIWDNFLFINDSKSHLYDEIYRTEEIIPSDVNSSNKPGYILKAFSDEELNELLPIYKDKFGLKGEISDSLREDLKNGFFLRVFSEVYRDKKAPKSINDLQLIKKYISLSLNKLDIDNNIALRLLTEIGKILLRADYSDRHPFRYEGVEIETILDQLDIPIDKNIPESLFSRNILIKTNDDDSTKISFYYSKVRDYIICYHSYKLDKLGDKEFKSTLKFFFENRIGQSAIYFYSHNAKHSHLRVLAKFQEYRFITYVEAYNSYLDKHFSNFKKSFDPHTDGDIGIIVPEDLTSTKGGYALYPLESSSQEKIIKDNNVAYFLSDRSRNIFSDYKARKIHGSYESLLSKETDKLVINNAFKQLKEIVKYGNLNESQSDILLIEKVVNIIYYHHKDLGYDFEINDYHYPRYSAIYPIDLYDISEKIYRFYATYHFKEMHIRDLIKSGKIPVKNNTYHIRLDSKDWEIINDKIDNAINNRISIPEPQVSGHFPPFVALNQMVSQLLRKGYISIDKHFLPTPDYPVSEIHSVIKKRNGRESWIPDIISAQFSEEQAKTYIKEFFKKLEDSYKQIVEYNFPTLKHELNFYSTLPHKYIVCMKDFENNGMRGFGYGTSSNSDIEIIIANKSHSELDYKKEGLRYFRGSYFSSLLRETSALRTVDNISTSKVDEYCILRNWVYDFLDSDVKKLIQDKEIQVYF